MGQDEDVPRGHLGEVVKVAGPKRVRRVHKVWWMGWMGCGAINSSRRTCCLHILDN